MPEKILRTALKTSQVGISSIYPAGRSKYLCGFGVSVRKVFGVYLFYVRTMYTPDQIGVMTYIWCLPPPVLCGTHCDAILARSDLCGRPAFHSPPIRLSSYSQGRGGLGLLGYWLVISNRGINSVSDGITTIINRSASSSPFNFPQMIEKKYIEPAFMFWSCSEIQTSPYFVEPYLSLIRFS